MFPSFDRWLVTVATIIGIVAPAVVALWRVAKRQASDRERLDAMNDPNSPYSVARTAEVNGVGERVTRLELAAERTIERVDATERLIAAQGQDITQLILTTNRQLIEEIHALALIVARLGERLERVITPER